MPDDPKEPELRPAAVNPWYVLMTVAGEQTGPGSDRELRARNRRYWNGFQAQALSDDESAQLIKDGRATEADLAPLTGDEEAAIAVALSRRCPGAGRPPPGAPINLRGCTFGCQLSCDGYVFPRGAGVFVGAGFTGSTFSVNASFAGATFLDSAFFEDVTFSRGADFSDVSFIGDLTSFERATFSRGATFASASFSGFASFKSADFSGEARFQGTIFSGPALFDGVTFSGDARFAGVTFAADASFVDATFQTRTSFGLLRHGPARPVRFLRAPPAFFGATLHEDTDFTDVEWPAVPHDADPEERRLKAVLHRRRYERLKLLMDSQKRVGDELMFQRLELRCCEAEATGDWWSRERWVARASRLFGALSEYGWNPARPLAYLGGLILAGWALIFIAEWWDYNLGAWPDPQRLPEYLGFWQSGALSFSNVFGFLGLNRTVLSDELGTLTALSEIVSTLQTICGLILLFLLGLTLRNRFRIK